MVGFWLLVAAWMASAFFGCSALKERSDKPEVLKEARVAVSIGTALAEGVFTRGAWPSDQWWEMFDDEQLSSLIERALVNNPSLKSATVRIEWVSQKAHEVRSALFPHLHFDFKDDYQHVSKDSLDRFPPSQVPAVINQIFLGLNFTYEIDLFGKNRELYRAAIGRLKAERAERAQSALMLGITVASTYFGYQAQLRERGLREERVEKARSYLHLVEERSYSGLDDKLAIKAARVRLSGEREKLVLIRKVLALSENQLKALLGMSPDDRLDLSFREAELDHPFPLPDHVPIELVSRRPDLMAQIWQLEAAAHRISAAKAAFFPNINLASFGRLEALSWSELFSVNSLAASIAPALSLPLFIGGKLVAALEKERAEFDGAVYDYNALILKAAKEVCDQIKTVEAVSEREGLQREVVADEERITSLKEARFKSGLDDQLTVLESKLKLLDEVIAKVDLSHRRYLALLQLVRALGGGYTSEGGGGHE